MEEKEGGGIRNKNALFSPAFLVPGGGGRCQTDKLNLNVLRSSSFLVFTTTTTTNQ